MRHPGVCRRGETVGVGDGSGRGERGRPHSPGRLREVRVRRLRASRLRLDDGARLRHRGADPRPETSLERLEQGFGLRLESIAELRHDVGDERGLTLAVFRDGALQRGLRGVQARADAPRGVRRGRAFGVDGGGVRLEVLHVRRQRRGNLSELCPLRRERGGRRRRGVVSRRGALLRDDGVRGDEFGHLRFGLVDGRAGGLGPRREGFVARFHRGDDGVDTRGHLGGAHRHGVGGGLRGEGDGAGERLASRVRVFGVGRRGGAGLRGEGGGAVGSLHEPSRGVVGSALGSLRGRGTRGGGGRVRRRELRRGGRDFGVEAVHGGLGGFSKRGSLGSLRSLLPRDGRQLRVHVRTLSHGRVERREECPGLGCELPLRLPSRREQGIPLGNFPPGILQFRDELEPLRLSLGGSLRRGNLFSLERPFSLVRAFTLADDLRLGELDALRQALHLGVFPRERRRSLFSLGLEVFHLDLEFRPILRARTVGRRVSGRRALDPVHVHLDHGVGLNHVLDAHRRLRVLQRGQRFIHGHDRRGHGGDDARLAPAAE